MVVLFKAAERRLTKKADGVVELPNTRIITATKELNRITDDIRGAQEAPEKTPSAIREKSSLVINTVGKILRRPPR